MAIDVALVQAGLDAVYVADYGIGLDDHVATVRRAAVKAIVAGASWVTVLTAELPNGAIRGQIRRA